MNYEQFKKEHERHMKVKRLYDNAGTQGEKDAAEAALDRIEPDWRMTAEEILKELEA